MQSPHPDVQLLLTGGNRHLYDTGMVYYNIKHIYDEDKNDYYRDDNDDDKDDDDDGD